MRYYQSAWERPNRSFIPFMLCTCSAAAPPAWLASQLSSGIVAWLVFVAIFLFSFLAQANMAPTDD